MKTPNYIGRPLFAACASATLLFVSSAAAQNVGIGISNPQSKLTVNGSTASGGIAVGDSTYNIPAPLNGAIIQGRTGIGTSSPQALLHVLNGDLLRSNADGTASATINTDGGIRLYRNPATASYIGGYLDLGITTAQTFVGRIFSYTGGPGQPPGLTTGSGVALTTDLGGSVPQLLVSSGTGFVGIGTTTPIAPLQVATSSVLTETGGVRTFFDFATAPVLTQQTVTTTTNAVSAVFSQCVFTGNAFISYGGTLTASDSRMKTVIDHSDSRKDLDLLRQIEVTDYTYIDQVDLGSEVHKKVIAQQVEKVLPEAVKKSTTFLPDIYTVASKIEATDGRYVITVPKPHHLENGDKVRLILEKGPDLYPEVKLVNDTTFSVSADTPITTKVFVYGKQHDDVRIVDYDAIAMLNVSATQELIRQIDAQNAKITALEAENAKLSAIVAKVENLEKAVNSLQTKAKTQSVALDH